MKLFRSLVVALLLSTGGVLAHEGSHASVHDTVASVLERMKRALKADEAVELTPIQALAFLAKDERQILATEHLRFTVNEPVVVTIIRDTSLGDEPFWLRERGFRKTGAEFTTNSRKFDLWEKRFGAGEIGLGVPSLSGSGTHYLVLVRPFLHENPITLTNVYPGHLRTAEFRVGVEPYMDRDVRVTAVPPELEGQLLLRTEASSVAVGKLVNVFFKTRFPSSPSPDHLVLTWSEDPRSTQTIQWRTSLRTPEGWVRYHPKMKQPGRETMRAEERRAETRRLSTMTILNDPLVYRHTATLRRLEPGTTYAYQVGDGSPDGWTLPSEFTTAPEKAESFSFVYMGDAQNGLDRWGVLLRNAYRARPDAAFYLLAGDLVNRGAERWDWDSFFEYSKGVFDRRPLVPAIGNHECQGGAPVLYLEQFTLPRNGPAHIDPERVYSFEYSNAKFIILDSNVEPALQTKWLERELAETTATWKFVAYHHPAYSSAPNRDNAKVRDHWTPLFDQYHVDLALQGHDHAYLRTHPMKDRKRVASPAEGTVYIVSVSGTKFYEQAERDYTHTGLTKVSTYQVLDIQINGNRLHYRAQDIDGNVRDEFIIEK